MRSIIALTFVKIMLLILVCKDLLLHEVAWKYEYINKLNIIYCQSQYCWNIELYTIMITVKYKLSGLLTNETRYHDDDTRNIFVGYG